MTDSPLPPVGATPADVPRPAVPPRPRIARGREHDRDHAVAEDDAGLEVGARATHAVGMPATLSIARRSRRLGPVRALRAYHRMNKPDGFDCPGCAWPEPAEGSHHLEFCENGVKAVQEEATKRTITRDFFARHAVSALRERTEHWLGQQGRLAEPMYLAPGADHYAPIGWDDAFALIGTRLRALPDPNRAAFYTSGRTGNEAAFVYQLLVRCLGTNNLPDCSNLCHESSGVALGETIGIGKGSVTINDLVAADVIVVAGQNPGTNHPRMLMALEQAKQRGARIITINPLPEAGLQRFDNPQTVRGLAGRGTQLTDLFLQVRLGGDLALFQAFNRLLLDAEVAAPGTVLDHDFLRERTDGLDALTAHLGALDWDAVLRATGLDRAQIEAAAAMLATSKGTVVCWAMGLTQHRDAVPTIREIVNLLLLRGQIGRKGAGVCPVRGHSNVQGDRTMGIWEKPPAAFLDALERTFGVAMPRDDGHDVVDAIRAMRDGAVDVFVAMGGNFAGATPDTPVTEAALARCALTVQISTKLNRSHVVTGREALILPTLGRTDRDLAPPDADGRRAPRFVTVEDSMSVVHASRGRFAPPSDALRSEVEIVCGIARASFGPRPDEASDPAEAAPVAGSESTGAARPSGDPSGDAPFGGPPTRDPAAVDWEAMAADYALIRRRIEATIPGFEQYELRASWPGGFVLPHPPRDEQRFETATGKARLTVNDLVPLEVPPGRLLLQSLRSHDQYNTTIYGLDDRYRGIKAGRRVVFVHPDDLAEQGLADGQIVDLVGEWHDGERRADGFRVVAYPTARGCAAAYYPETNPLVPLDSTAKGSNTPTSKAVLVRIEVPGERSI